MPASTTKSTGTHSAACALSPFPLCTCVAVQVDPLAVLCVVMFNMFAPLLH
jgi:hypothetical protein